jgi:hypothetical protein
MVVIAASALVAALWLDILGSRDSACSPPLAGPFLHCGNMAALFPSRFKHDFAPQ